MSTISERLQEQNPNLATIPNPVDVQAPEVAYPVPLAPVPAVEPGSTWQGMRRELTASGFASPEPKPMMDPKASLEQIKEAQKSADQTAILNLARSRDNSLGSDNVLLRDYAQMDPSAFTMKYGTEAADAVRRQVLDTTYLARAESEPANRSTGTYAKDQAVEVGSGFVQGAAGAASLGSLITSTPWKAAKAAYGAIQAAYEGKSLTDVSRAAVDSAFDGDATTPFLARMSKVARETAR